VAESERAEKAAAAPAAKEAAALPAAAGLHGSMLMLQRTAGNAAVARMVAAGQLAKPLRGDLERSFGRDLGHVRVHADDAAARSARAEGAVAYARGHDIVVDRASLPGDPKARQFVIAHEVAHVLQAEGGAAAPSAPAEREAHAVAAQTLAGRPAGALRERVGADVVHRFQTSERDQIAKLSDVIDTARDMAKRSMVDRNIVKGIDWPTFVNNAGGFSAFDVGARALSIKPSISPLPHRYLMTARCGMLDMRHFYQMMYIALVKGNAKSTQMGREHELNSEDASRFGAEDTPSNALGALFGASYADGAGGSPDAFANALKVYLERCDPVDFTAMPATEQNTIVDYYGGQTGGKPTNQTEVATPAVLALPSLAGKDRTYPFYLERGDAKTISDTESQKSDTEIRTWVFGHDPADHARVSSSERNRMASRLLDGWVADGDIEALLLLRSSAPNDADRDSLDAIVRPRISSLSDFGQRAKLQLVIK
jgi:hypothetical protein